MTFPVRGCATLLLLALLGIGCKPTSTPPTTTQTKAQWFTDVTSASGLNFIHVAATNYFMPDQMGSGITLLDFNQDGRLDIYLVQNSGTNSSVRNQLFQQNPDRTFKNVSTGSGVDALGRGMGAIAGDVNNDGFPDLIVTEYGATRLFQNLGGEKFQEVTREAGIDNPQWAVPASFIDYDRDGRLDLVVGNYVDYDPTQVCHDVQGQRDFCAPRVFGATATRLWRNITPKPGAPPRFEERTEQAGIAKITGAALGLVCADFDGDGWPDIFCADDGRPNRLFINQHNGTFTEQAAIRGLAFNAMGQTAGNMGVAFADVDGDGASDLFVSHLREEFHSLFRQDRQGFFIDVVSSSGLQKQAWRGTGFGSVLADFDQDGAPDLAFVSGLVSRNAPAQTPILSGISEWWGRYAQRSQLFANDGKGGFRDISEENPALCRDAIVGRSLAAGDLDGDGAPDLVVGTIGGPIKIYRNNIPSRGHWLRLRLVEPQLGGRDAIGAEAIVHAGGRKFWNVLQPATSYLASNEPLLHFGLGKSESVDSIAVKWPDGVQQEFPGARSDQLLTLERKSD